MTKPLFLLLASVCCWLPLRAAVPPPEKLLPKDTVVVVTAPDWDKGWKLLTGTSYGRLWQDPALKPFRDKFIDKFTGQVLTPLEQNFKIKLSDYQGLAQGQVTFAVVPTGRPDNADFHFAQVLLVDAKDHAGELKNNLADIQKKWADAGRPMRIQKLRDIDFTTLIVSPDDLAWNKIFQKTPPASVPADNGNKPPKKNIELTIGQSGSLLIVGDSTEAIEKILSRQAGGMAPPLSDQQDFQADYGARLRNSPLYAWVNARSLLDVLAKSAPEAPDSSSSAALRFSALADVLGLTDVSSACFSYEASPDGVGAQLFVRLPEAHRHGLIKALAPDAKDASPPPFVPADAVKYWRWRVNIPQSWSTLEKTLNSANPGMVAVFNAALQMAGKDKDEHYDLKSELLGNLGDDIMGYQKPPAGNSLADLKSAPSLVLIASPNPRRLAAALKTGLGVIARGGLKDREFLGRTIYTVPPAAPGQGLSLALSFAGSASYVAMSSDAALLEEYLRGNDSTGQPLAGTPGLGDAAQKAGGMATGWFGYENQSANARPLFEVLRQQPVPLADFLGTPQAVNEQLATLWGWMDFSLLPPFDTVSKYFYYSVYAGSFSAEGFTLKIFAPAPPRLR
ncbi:MAG: hypothetical protein ACLQVY_23230 [Limisphaerales bacterium]